MVTTTAGSGQQSDAALKVSELRPVALAAAIGRPNGRLQLLVLSMTSLWLLELLIARGPLRGTFGGIWSPVLTVIIFGFAGIAALRLQNQGEQSTTTARSHESSFPGVALTLAGALLAILAVRAGVSRYNADLQGHQHSTLGQLWAPVVLAGLALLLGRPGRLDAMSRLVVAAGLAAGSLSGGRTIAGLGLAMFLLRSLFVSPLSLPAALGTSRRVFRVAVGVLVVVLAVLALTAYGARRTTAAGNASFSSESLAANGYSFGPVVVRQLLGTMGVIGESSRVVHAAVPKVVPHAGPGLLVEDSLSFLPSFSATVVAATIPPYRGVGSIVTTSHPSGTPTTFYLLGGRTWVAIGGFAYCYILGSLLKRARRSRMASSTFMLLGSTFALGVYGTGTPTAATALATLLCGGICLGAKLDPDVREQCEVTPQQGQGRSGSLRKTS